MSGSVDTADPIYGEVLDESMFLAFVAGLLKIVFQAYHQLWEDAIHMCPMKESYQLPEQSMHQKMEGGEAMMSLASQREPLAVVAPGYHTAQGQEHTHILEEFVASTGRLLWFVHQSLHVKDPECVLL